ncbi:hypothetical protein ACTV1V_000573 [Cronobacter turicensis]|uniref:hypothetical protein n=1 Tax=Cronobacter turicensis TaxID=413502 RepID=UPI001375560E|nr:hypothetical protein [Cronobacter turicensis]MEB8541014.1 hypothetical protein [Cronobacter sakazakii]EKM0529518.1 hypothetical protein [Cronobacter turicensis]ELQ6001477.1 hypothetical protein [Cronobacter turicensis]ELQ6130736.1 hypothetical protein [Cronobacter turicensis]ELY3554142.1 hypothetical protein [Cronobacter turicensis]
MNINQAAIEKLLRINWLQNAGKHLDIAGTVRIENIIDFENSLQSEEWENTSLEARNNITGFLAKNHSSAFLEWNKLADIAADFIENKIVPKIPFVAESQEMLLSNIKWDLMNYLLEDAYGSYLNKPFFFGNLINIYEKGHIPCGWDSQWPRGNLIIY